MSSSSSSDAALLNAIAKRSSQNELDRLQTISTLLLAQLKSNSKSITSVVTTTRKEKKITHDDDETRNNNHKKIITKSLQWSSVSPRFIYMAASNKIIRSADRGKTWKAIPLPSIISSSSSSSSSTTSSTPPATTVSTNSQKASSSPKIIRIASCSTTGAVAFCGTQSSIGLSLKVGGPFQMLTLPVSNTPNPSTNNIILNTLFFDSCGLLLFVGSTVSSPNFLYVYNISSSSWFTVFSSSSSSSSSPSSQQQQVLLSVSCFKLLRENIESGFVEIGIFFSPTNTSTNSSTSTSSSSSLPSSVVKNKNSKILQKVSAASASTAKSGENDQQENKKKQAQVSTMLVDGVGGFQLFQVSRFPSSSSSVSSNASAVIRKSPMIPHKLGSVLNCEEIDPFSIDDENHILPPSFILRRFRWISRWRPGAHQNQNNNNSTAKNPKGTRTTMMRTSSSKKPYDYTIGSIVPSSQLPFVTDFFTSTSSKSTKSSIDEPSSSLIENLNEDDSFLVVKKQIAVPPKKKKKPVDKKNDSSSSSSSSDDDDEDDDKPDEIIIDDTFRGGLFPQTAPRLFACYSSAGRVVDSDATSFLWFWLGEPTDMMEEQHEEGKNDEENEKKRQAVDQDAGAIYTTVTNISYLPLVQSFSSSNSSSSSLHLNAGGSLLNVLDHGRSWLRCGLNGVATSYDGGRNWSEPQLACISACTSLDRQSHLVVSSRPGFAVLPELEGAAVKQQQQSQQQVVNPKKWNLFTIPSTLGCSVMSDVCILE